MRTTLLLLGLGALTLPPPARAADTINLSSLDLRIKQDMGEFHRDQTADGSPITIAGQKFDHGVGTHSNSSMSLGLDGKAEAFSAKVGVDDEITDVGTITFTLTGDGRKLWESPAMNFGDAPVSISVDLHGVRTLVLTARDGGDGNNHDHADWADAKIVMTSGQPTVLDPDAGIAASPAASATNSVSPAK